MVLHDMLYVGGWPWSGDLCRLFVSRTDPIRWRERLTPTSRCALAAYHSQLVLIGGYEANTRHRTNKLWTSNAGENWKESLPPMPTPRHSSSALSIGTPEHLVVAGGSGDDTGTLNTVEVLTDNVWWTAEPLPKKCRCMKSALHNGKFYLIGGHEQGTGGYYCDVKSFLLWHQLPNDQNDRSPLWSQFQLPTFQSTPACFGDCLVSIGGSFVNHRNSLGIAAFSPLSQVWISVGRLPDELGSVGACAVLQTGDLVVIGDAKVSKASWEGENHSFCTPL